MMRLHLLRLWPLRGALLLGVAGLAGAVLAAPSPTETYIRIERMRGDSETPVVKIRSVPGGQGKRTTQATAQGRTLPIAKQAAERGAIRGALGSQLQLARDVRHLRNGLATVLAETRSLRTRIRQQDRGRGGFTVTAEVEGDPLRERVVQELALSPLGVMLRIRETSDGTPTGASQVQSALSQALIKTNFRVYEPTFDPLLQERWNRVASTYLAGNLLIGTVQARFSQSNAGIISYVATADLRLVRAATGMVLTAQHTTAKGFGRDRRQASDNALAALAETVSAETAEACQARLKQFQVKIELPAHDPAGAAELHDWLKQHAGVREVARTESQDQPALRVTTTESPALLAAQLEDDLRFRIVSYRGSDARSVPTSRDSAKPGT